MIRKTDLFGRRNLRSLVSRDGPPAQGFTLVEMLLAIVLMTFGLLTSGQIILLAMSSNTLARSMANAALVAQSKLEHLTAEFDHDPSAPDLAIGIHGPELKGISSQSGDMAFNRFSVIWEISQVGDPRPRRLPRSRQIVVCVTPINMHGLPNVQPRMNKTARVTTVVSPNLNW